MVELETQFDGAFADGERGFPAGLLTPPPTTEV